MFRPRLGIYLQSILSLQGASHIHKKFYLKTRWTECHTFCSNLLSADCGYSFDELRCLSKKSLNPPNGHMVLKMVSNNNIFSIVSKF